MKSITFLRHAQPKEPYDDYEKLTLKELDKLARQMINPNIGQVENMDQKLLTLDVNLNEIEKIFYASSRRAFQTAKLISHSSSLLSQDSLFNEIMFSPASFVKENEFRDYGLDPVRSRLFDEILRGSLSSERIEDIYKRIFLIERLLNSCVEQKIICITHGFLMRFLFIYFSLNVKNSAGITKTLIENVENYNFLSGFTVELSYNGDKNE